MTDKHIVEAYDKDNDCYKTIFENTDINKCHELALVVNQLIKGDYLSHELNDKSVEMFDWLCIDELYYEHIDIVRYDKEVWGVYAIINGKPTDCLYRSNDEKTCRQALKYIKLMSQKDFLWTCYYKHKPIHHVCIVHIPAHS